MDEGMEWRSLRMGVMWRGEARCQLERLWTGEGVGHLQVNPRLQKSGRSAPYSELQLSPWIVQAEVGTQCVVDGVAYESVRGGSQRTKGLTCTASAHW